MKKIVISAYFNNNLGDDLFVSALINRYPECLFYVDADENDVKYLSQFENVRYSTKTQIFFRKAFERIFKHKYLCFHKKADALVKIGGSIFIEYDGWEKNWPELTDGRTFIIGANFGPYKTDDYIRLVENKICKAVDCCFRDSNSYNVFRHLKNVRLAPDVLFGYQMNRNTKVEKKRVGISVISLNNRDDLKTYANDYYRCIAQVSEILIEQGYSVCLYAFCENEGDAEAIDSVQSLSNYRFEKIIYSGNISNFMDSFGSCEYVLATRFHAMVLGWTMGKKVYPLIYSNKQLNIIEDINSECKYSNIKDINLLSAEDIVKALIEGDELDVSNEVKHANQQFFELDKYVQER